jgi:hypothetical protein
MGLAGLYAFDYFRPLLRTSGWLSARVFHIPYCLWLGIVCWQKCCSISNGSRIIINHWLPGWLADIKTTILMITDGPLNIDVPKS